MNCPPVHIGQQAEVTQLWPLVLVEDVAFDTGRDYGATLLLCSGNKTLGTIHRGYLWAHAYYALDGYSPVFYAPWKAASNDPWLRLTPTPACGYAPALVHDITRQFHNVEGCPWDRKQTDDWFFDSLIAGGVPKRRAGAYHHAVAGPIGDVYIALTRKADPNLHIIRKEYRS